MEERKFSEQELVRREKMQELIDKGIDPFGQRFDVTAYSKGIKEQYGDKTHEELEEMAVEVSVAGRIMTKRRKGKVCFMHIQDRDGQIQLYVRKDTIGEEAYEIVKKGDIGDIIGIKGTVFMTNTGECSIKVSEYTHLTKALRPLPEKFHGLTDQDAVYRERHLDLIMNDDAKKRFVLRTKFIRLMREFLDTHEFLEVDTPVLQNTASGATAKPFITHHNALDMDVYLRISPELTLKKLIIGGFSNVYEIARDFRNEGMDANHLQDFTMVEGYSAYWCYRDNMKFLREMIIYILSKLFDGNLNIKIGEQEIDFGGEWQVVSFRDLILKDCGIDIDKFETAESLLAEIKAKGIKLEADNLEQLGRGNLIDTLYKKVSRPNIINPTYLIEHPIDLSPLARSNDENPKLTDRFQLVVNGQEIINGYSELVDCDEQERRFIEQAELKANGDEEAMSIDTEYIRAMQYGMPPISGWGLGIDRFLQFLTNSDNIRDVVLYPLMKPRAAEESEE